MHVVCDRCGDPLCWPADDQGSDGRDTRFFDNIATAESTALRQGWGQLDPFDDHIGAAMQCTECRGRIAAMRSWIKVNRMIDHVDD